MRTHCTRAVSVALAMLVLPCGDQEEDSIEAEVEKVEVGSAAPNFTVSNDKEDVVELKDYLADDNVVLVFVRAHW